MGGLMELGRGRAHVALEWRRTGGDLSVTITGGERPHIGAAALAEPGQTPVPVLEASGHREGPLAAQCAGLLCRALGCTVLVSCGIHIDSAAPEEIRLLCANARQLAEALAAQLARA